MVGSKASAVCATDRCYGTHLGASFGEIASVLSRPPSRLQSSTTEIRRLPRGAAGSSGHRAAMTQSISPPLHQANR
jgi:hypothetical protein